MPAVRSGLWTVVVRRVGGGGYILDTKRDEAVAITLARKALAEIEGARCVWVQDGAGKRAHTYSPRSTRPRERFKASSQGGILLDVARKLPAPFTLGDLVVAVWKARPDLFGLAGYRHEHPDAGRVNSSVAGKRGLVRRGMLRLVGPRLYRVEGA